MESEPHPKSESTLSPSTCHPGSTSRGNGIFSGAHSFTVAGGTFKITTKSYNTTAPNGPADFRMIPLGDIDLRHEIRLDHDSRIVNCRCERGCVRRIYSGKVNGPKLSVTVAVYQGNGAEEKWKQDNASYESIRHPNIMQIYCVASSDNIHATVFLDDLIPLEQFLCRYRCSHFSSVYIHAYCNTDFWAARKYFASEFQRTLDWAQCTIWMRRSTGRLCVDLMQPSSVTWWFNPRHEIPAFHGTHALSELTAEAAVVEALTLREYHDICQRNMSRRQPIVSISTCITVKLGAVFSFASSHRLENAVEIASLANAEAYLGPWQISGSTMPELMDDGWVRFRSDEVLHSSIWLITCQFKNFASWLSQANYIFRCLQITSNFDDYVLVTHAYFELKLSARTHDCSPGFLFLCPEANLQTSSSSFSWPDCPAYWSLDPFGISRLSPEKASQDGFPSIKLITTIHGWCWDPSVYAGLRHFHQVKGFDPDTQDIARHLRYPLYQLSDNAEHVDVNEGNSDKRRAYGDEPFVFTYEQDFDVTYNEPGEEDEPFTNARKGDFYVGDLDTGCAEDEPYNDEWNLSPLSVSEKSDYDGDEAIYSGEGGRPLDTESHGGTQTSDSEDHRSGGEGCGCVNGTLTHPAKLRVGVVEGAQDLTRFHDISPTFSRTFKFVTNVRFALILFLGLSWLYNRNRDVTM